MVERRIIVDGINVSYSGIFDLSELYKLIDHFLRERAYTKHELSAQEDVYKDGKRLSLTKQPYKKISDYARYDLKIKIAADHVKDKVIEVAGHKRHLHEGDVTVTFFGFLTTDYEGRWDKKPMFYFLRALFDQYVYKIHVDKYESGLVEEVNLLYNLVKRFLTVQQ
ncbi:MAG: hypothetical protein ABIC95_02565 [archaeon]